jgi:tetratricopeptide (TPR) repeat protein
VPVAERIRMLESHMLLVERRDDLYLELVRAYNEQGDCKKAIKLLQSHTFTPCEGGEHAILEQYIFAHFKLGREALREGKYEEALSYFRNGQTFSKNLGAGVWNIAMKIPCMYYEAKALDHIDENKAKDIYRFIADMGIDLFSYMYQPSMDYYRAMTFERLGEKAKAKTLLENAVAEWAKKKAEKDYGYFQLTPFFLSFLQRPADTRQVHYGYLLGLGYLGLGDRQRAKECFENVLAINSGHLLAAMEKSFIR